MGRDRGFEGKEGDEGRDRRGGTEGRVWGEGERGEGDRQGKKWGRGVEGREGNEGRGRWRHEGIQVSSLKAARWPGLVSGKTNCKLWRFAISKYYTLHDRLMLLFSCSSFKKPVVLWASNKTWVKSDTCALWSKLSFDEQLIKTVKLIVHLRSYCHSVKTW